MGFVSLPLPAMRLSVFALTLLFLTTSVASGQDVDQPTTSPAHVAVVDGAATLEREGQAETAVTGMPFVPGDRLQTTRGRVEVMFADGTALAIDEFTAIELQDASILRMTAGRLLLTVAGVNDPSNAVRYQIDTPAASATTDGPGEYRIAIMNGRGALETELAVFRGYGTLATDVGSTAVRAGERTLARDLLAPSHPLPFNSARFDAFEVWASARRNARLGTASTRYLPRDLYSYSGTFDQYGSWGYEGPYGNVWYPTVAPGWRPYHHGYWSPIRRYGWTWIGHDVWGWPTHHYGRWGFARSRWFWIPGRTWGPAWVSWASAPGFLGWCPLGFDGRPVFGLSVSVGNPWNGWVVVPRQHFGHRYAVHQYALAPAAIPARTPFIVQQKAPLAIPAAVGRPRAIPRPTAVAPTQRAGNQAISRGGQAAVAAAAQPAAANTQVAPANGRTRVAVPRGATTAPNAPADANRYIPETTTLGGRRAAAAVPRQPSSEPTARDTVPAPTTASPRWYPPVNMTRPRAAETAPADVDRSPAASPWTTPGTRQPRLVAPPATIQPNQPELSGAGRVPGAAPWSAQPRRPVGAPPPTMAPQPQVAPPRATAPQQRQTSEPPRAAPPPRAPMAAPRAAPQQQQEGSQQAAPAQPSGGRSAPAGARSPRSR